MSTLLELEEGQSGIITKIRGRGAFRRRLAEMGFVKGKEVTVIKAAPLQDPIEYKILGYNVSLRRSEARQIEVWAEADYDLQSPWPKGTSGYHGTLPPEVPRAAIEEKGKTIEIALVGNPNCGKTTLFNYASGSRERVGNFSGVTVDSKTAEYEQGGYRFQITDLPGTYSLSPYSPEELFVRRYIFENSPDIVVNVVDAANLERNLYLTTQLIDMDIRIVIALNMYDELDKSGRRLDYESLGQLIGIPMVPTVSTRGKGIAELFDRIIDIYEGRDKTERHVHINYGPELEGSIRVLQEPIRKDTALTDSISSRYLAIKLLEKDANTLEQLQSTNQFDSLLRLSQKEIHRLETIFKEDVSGLLTDAKYGFIAGALKETIAENPRQVKSGRTYSEKIDLILTSKLWGFPVFLCFLWLMFQTTFSLGEFPKRGIEMGVAFIATMVEQWLPPGLANDFFVNGLIHGVGSVIVFLPNILILFFFLSVMEDTGYMARAAFIMDKLMHKMGLHGQSFIPLVMGFGCNVPAIMATRTLKDRNDRLLTMLINPFMSCSARLPVYILVTGAVFPGYAGTVVFGLYLGGTLMVIAASLILKKTLFRSKEAPFVMELPPYRLPTIKVVLRHMWGNAQHYLRKMSGMILIAVILVWALEYFPRGGDTVHSTGRLENSYIAVIGKWIEPVIRPLGFDWRMGVSLISGATAKEVVVSTMGVLLQAPHYHESGQKKGLTESLQHATYQSGPKKGEKIFTPVVSLSYLIFILTYMPCMAVVATVRRESGHWKWAIFLVAYTTAAAWLLSFAVYQIGIRLFPSL